MSQTLKALRNLMNDMPTIVFAHCCSNLYNSSRNKKQIGSSCSIFLQLLHLFIFQCFHISQFIFFIFVHICSYLFIFVRMLPVTQITETVWRALPTGSNISEHANGCTSTGALHSNGCTSTRAQHSNDMQRTIKLVGHNW